MVNPQLPCDQLCTKTQKQMPSFIKTIKTYIYIYVINTHTYRGATTLLNAQTRGVESVTGIRTRVCAFKQKQFAV